MPLFGSPSIAIMLKETWLVDLEAFVSPIAPRALKE